MRKFSMLFFLLFLVEIASVSAQQSAVNTSQQSDFDKALSLYNDKQYLAAQILFEKVMQDNNGQETESDCAYYIANCAIRLNQNNADQMMEDFVANYPTSTKQN